MRILITGGNGFIGEAVKRKLGNLSWASFDSHTPGNDIRNLVTLARAFEVFRPTSVIHLAGMLGTSELFNDPTAAIEVNVIGTANVLRCCERFGSGYVGITMPEVWDNVYQATKSAARILADAWNRHYDVPVSHVRAFNVFGPGQKLDPVQKLVPTFAYKAWRGEPLPIWGDGTQQVDLVYVDDVARMLVDATQFSKGEVFDAGTGDPLTVNEVASWIIRLTKSSSPLEFHPMRRGEHEAKVVADGIGWDELGWRPTFKLSDFVRTINYYKDHINYLKEYHGN